MEEQLDELVTVPTSWTDKDSQFVKDYELELIPQSELPEWDNKDEKRRLAFEERQSSGILNLKLMRQELGF